MMLLEVGLPSFNFFLHIDSQSLWHGMHPPLKCAVFCMHLKEEKELSPLLVLILMHSSGAHEYMSPVHQGKQSGIIVLHSDLLSVAAKSSSKSRDVVSSPQSSRPGCICFSLFLVCNFSPVRSLCFFSFSFCRILASVG